ncbi:branched-chain amino acid ABC transporter substrate-binding protein [Maritimibacter alkaliphilus]|uniref:branched-chain amino acid ABC transporter substrate-binding protein n=1 Tax=Maritimibacter alkaliphilus TaxID=404236 RepID=UPI001C94B9E3|nr:branched-chain amino acid ABC transporter substrate-binding protein [Maritimibacter alkaliphilus]MBY6090347.1 branched-chain amino acid ABC transporter substrate-binding protein [Maritimibacter alkaliphilus]
MKLIASAALAAAMSFVALGASADTLKVAFIDPLSGPMGPSGESGLKHFMFAAEELNADGGVNGAQVEVVGFDNKVNPKESLVQLQKAIDQGIRYVVQGNGSSVASALIDAIEKHNKRNPGEEVLFLNYAAVDPAFTNEKCSFWHFRFDSDADMKMEAVTDWVAAHPDIKSVYIIGQDYSFGKAVAAAAVRMLEVKAPEVKIVGNELHPLAKVKDFTPYVQKIINSGADAIITGNWGSDMVLLVKAAIDAGWDKPILTYYGGSTGAATAMGEAAVGKVKQVSEVVVNYPSSPEQEERIAKFEEKYPENNYYYHRAFNLMHFLDAAAEKAGSNDPVKVAFAMEGMEMDGAYGHLTMRKDNHQILQDLFVGTFSANPPRGVEGLPLGWMAEDKDHIAAAATSMETTCKMDRPEM